MLVYTQNISRLESHTLPTIYFSKVNKNIYPLYMKDIDDIFSIRLYRTANYVLMRENITTRTYFFRIAFSVPTHHTLPANPFPI